MTLEELARSLELDVRAAAAGLSRTVAGGCAGDLLSDIIAHGRKDDLWVTIQVHPNILAVAVLKELAGIVIAGGREPAAETVERAEREGVPLLVSRLGAFECIGRLHGLGLKGS